MKKFLSVTLLFVMLVMAVSTVVNAATDTLADDIYAKAEKYGMTAADKVKVERFISDNEISDADAEAVLAQIDEAVAIMEAAGVTDYNELSAADKAILKDIAVAVADTLDVELVFKSGEVNVYKDGKLLETISLEDGKVLARTGSNMNVALTVSIVAVIALAMTVVAKKTIFANAR